MNSKERFQLLRIRHRLALFARRLTSVDPAYPAINRTVEALDAIDGAHLLHAAAQPPIAQPTTRSPIKFPNQQKGTR